MTIDSSFLQNLPPWPYLAAGGVATMGFALAAHKATQNYRTPRNAILAAGSVAEAGIAAILGIGAVGVGGCSIVLLPLLPILMPVAAASAIGAYASYKAAQFTWNQIEKTPSPCQELAQKVAKNTLQFKNPANTSQIP